MIRRSHVVSRHRTARALLVVVVALLGGMIASGVGATPASAHATLQSTTPDVDQVLPQAPVEVTLRFDEAVDASIGGVQVYGPDGARVDSGKLRSADNGTTAVQSVKASARGTYTVAWRAVSDDGHTISGSFVFHVGEKSGSKADIGGSSSVTSFVGWLSRLLTFAGAIACLGALVFGVATRAAADSRLASLTWWAAAVAQLGSFGIIWTRAAQVSGKSLPSAFGVLGQLVDTNRSGLLDAVRVGLALVALVATLTPNPRTRLAAVPAMVGVLLTFALSGHAWTASPVGFTVAVDTLHTVAVSAWVGGLIALALVIRRVHDRETVVRRFSTVATVGLVVAALTGVMSALVHIDAWSSLWNTSYGRLVAVKVLVVGLMAILGAVHRQAIARHVERIAQWFTTISIEASLGVVALGITAALVFTIPSIDARPQRFSATATTPTGKMTLEIAPAKVGLNDLRLAFATTAGKPRSVDATEVTIGTSTIPSRRLDLNLDDSSHVTAAGASFGTPGTWRVTVVTVTRGVSESSTFEVDIR